MGAQVFQPPKVPEILAFLLIWLSGLRVESGMNLQRMVWKSLSRQGNWSPPYNVGIWALLNVSYGEQTLEETVLLHGIYHGMGQEVTTQPRTFLSSETLKP